MFLDKPPIDSWIKSAEKQGSSIPRYLAYNTSVAACKYEFASNKAGQLFFFRFGNGKEWRQSELNILGELSSTVSLYVTLRSRLEESDTEIKKI